MDEPPKTPSAESVPPESEPPESEDDAATKVSELPADLMMELGPPPEPFVEPVTPPGGAAIPSPMRATPLRPAAGDPPRPAEPAFPAGPMVAPPQGAAARAPQVSPAAMTFHKGFEPPPMRAPVASQPGSGSIQVRPATAAARGDESIDTSGDTHLNQIPGNLPGPSAPVVPPMSPFVPASAQGQGGFTGPGVRAGQFPMAPPPFAQPQSLSSSGIVWAIGGILVGLLLVALIVLALYLLLGRS